MARKGSSGLKWSDEYFAVTVQKIIHKNEANIYALICLRLSTKLQKEIAFVYL